MRRFVRCHMMLLTWRLAIRWRSRLWLILLDRSRRRTRLVRNRECHRFYKLDAEDGPGSDYNFAALRHQQAPKQTASERRRAGAHTPTGKNDNTRTGASDSAAAFNVGCGSFAAMPAFYFAFGVGVML